jgi:hypothetical protein
LRNPALMLHECVSGQKDKNRIERIAASCVRLLDMRFLMDKAKPLPSNYGILCHLQKTAAKLIQIGPGRCL